MLMKLSGAFCLLWCLLVSQLGNADTEVVALELSMDRQSYSVGDRVVAELSVRNTANKPIATAVSLRGYNGKSFVSFEITLDGQRLRYDGEQTLSDVAGIPVVELEPGRKISAVVNVSDWYDMMKPGTYAVRAVYRQPPQDILDKYGKPNVIDGELRSNEVQIHVTDNSMLFQEKLEIFRKNKSGSLRISHSLHSFSTERGTILRWERSVDRAGLRTENVKDLSIVGESNPVLLADPDGKVYLFVQESSDKYRLYVHNPSPLSQGDYFHEFSIEEGLAPPSVIVRANGEMTIFSEEKLEAKLLERAEAKERELTKSPLVAGQDEPTGTDAHVAKGSDIEHREQPTRTRDAVGHQVKSRVQTTGLNSVGQCETSFESVRGAGNQETRFQWPVFIVAMPIALTIGFLIGWIGRSTKHRH